MQPEISSGLPANTRSTSNPFPGLRPFEPDESDLFFGREADIAESLHLLKNGRFLALVGASGSGKSSLVRAGIIASLRHGYLVRDDGYWLCAPPVLPGNSPLVNLASAITSLAGNQSAASVPSILETLQRSSFGLIEAIKMLDLPVGMRVFFLIDQFEELFRLRDRSGTAPSDEGVAFVKLLLQAKSQDEVPIYVAMTMRSDFLGSCTAYPGLADAINDGIYLLPRITREGLRAAIQAPIQAFSGTVTDRLVNRLLNDAGRQEDGTPSQSSDQLPVLQHALMRMWARADGSDPTLDIPQYEGEGIGTLDQCLEIHAEEVFTRIAARDHDAPKAAEWLFCQLAESSPEGSLQRIPRQFGDIIPPPGIAGGLVTSLVELLRAPDCCFLLPSGNTPPAHDTTIFVSHEALLRKWKRLFHWLKDEEQHRHFRSRLEAAASTWHERKQGPDFLFRGVQLGEAEMWAAANPSRLTKEINEFLVESKAAQQSTTVEALLKEAESRRNSISKNKATIFLCYPPLSIDKAQALTQRLQKHGFLIITGFDEESPTVADIDTTYTRIATADVFVYLASRSSIDDPWAKASVERAILLGKRIVLAAAEQLRLNDLPAYLHKYTLVHMGAQENIQRVVDRLIRAMGSDYALVATHTRLLQRAEDWKASKMDSALLLRGSDLSQALDWLSQIDSLRLNHLRATARQRAFVKASQIRARYRQVLWHFIVPFLSLVFVSLVLYLGKSHRQQRSRDASLASLQKVSGSVDSQIRTELFDEALTSLQQSLDLSNDALKDLPPLDQQDHVKTLGKSALNLALNFETSGRNDAALASYTVARNIFLKADAIRPNESYVKADLAATHRSIGNQELAKGNLREALKHHLKCNQYFQQLYKSDTSNNDWKQGLASSFESLGDIYQQRWKRDDALTSFKDSVYYRSLLVQATSNSLWQQHLACSYERIGDVQLAMGKLEEAGKSYDLYHGIFKKLVETYPTDPAVKRGMAFSRKRLGDVLLASDKPGEALAEYTEYQNYFKDQTTDPRNRGNSELRRENAYALQCLGDTQLRLGNLPVAIENYKEAVKLMEPLATAPLSPVRLLRDFAQLQASYGNALVVRGDSPPDLLPLLNDAHENSVEAAKIATLDLDAQAGKWRTQYYLARALIAKGDGELDRAQALLKEGKEALQALDKEWGLGFRQKQWLADYDRAIASLRQPA